MWFSVLVEIERYTYLSSQYYLKMMSRGKRILNLLTTEDDKQAMETTSSKKTFISSEVKTILEPNTMSLQNLKQISRLTATEKVHNYLQNNMMPLNENLSPPNLEYDSKHIIDNRNINGSIISPLVDSKNSLHLVESFKTAVDSPTGKVYYSLQNMTPFNENLVPPMEASSEFDSKHLADNVHANSFLISPSDDLKDSLVEPCKTTMNFKKNQSQVNVLQNIIIQGNFLENEGKTNNSHENFTVPKLEIYSNNNKENFVPGSSELNIAQSGTESSGDFSNSSDTDYIPPSTESTESHSIYNMMDEISSNSSGEIPVQNFTLKCKERSPSLDISEPVKKNGYIPENSKPNFGKDLCPICFEEVGHFSRHLIRKHSDDEIVRKILKMPLKSNDRRLAITALRKKGNFILKQERNELKPTRKPKNRLSNISEKITDDEYVPCINCLGYYKKTYLWRHKKICKSNTTSENGSKIQHLTEAQTFLASTGLLGNYLNKSRLKKDVFGIMRADKISLIAKSDPVICLYGESYLNKHTRKQMNVVVSNKMRELARLKLALQKSTTITMLIDILKPELYNSIIAASKIISGYDPETQTFKASSLALHLGTSLKFLCDVARKALISKDPLFRHLNRDEKLKEISDIRELIESHWCNDISSLANKVLNQKKYEKPTLLPLTEDVQAFKNYITTLADSAFEKLKEYENVTHNYKVLTECTLSIVLVFNRKRIGEVQFLEIDTYERNFSTVNQEECLSALSELEKSMSATFKRVVVFGKGSKPVPILFTKQMQKFINLLLQVRRSSDVVPTSNKYVFANPGSTDRWMSGASVLRKMANKCGAKNPELLTSSRFRKQIATILQLMSFEKDEMEQIARFMGHTEKTHTEFYRLSEDIYQTAKVAKVLLLLNAGKGSEFKGKSLEEIQIAGEVIDYDDNEQEVQQNEKNDQERETKVPQIENNETDSIFHESATSNKSYEEHKDQENVAIDSARPPIKSGPNCSKVKRGRVQWSAQEKKLVNNFFKRHVKNKKAPKKEECISFIRQNLNLFGEDDWVRIKTLVYNTYRDK